MPRAILISSSLGLALLLGACTKKRELEPPGKVPAGESSASSAPTQPGKAAPAPDTVDGYQVIHAKTKGGDNATIKLEAPEGWTIIKPPSEPDPHGGKFGLDEALEGLLPKKGRLVARITTDLGSLECTLFEEQAPNTVANFVGLARGLRSFYHIKEGAWVKRPLYDGSVFHRVVPEFMVQGGDYLGGRGRLGYMIPDENVTASKHDRAGQLCMANRGPNTNESQFFVTDGPAPHLDGGYTIFGECSPASVVYKIARVPQSGPPLNQPLTPVRIQSVRIERTNTPAPESEPPPSADVPPGRAVEVER